MGQNVVAFSKCSLELNLHIINGVKFAFLSIGYLLSLRYINCVNTIIILLLLLALCLLLTLSLPLEGKWGSI